MPATPAGGHFPSISYSSSEAGIVQLENILVTT